MKVLNPETIEELKETKGITVFETSENIKDAANNAIELMGYTNLSKLSLKMSGINDEYAEILTNEKNLMKQCKMPQKNMQRCLNPWIL